MVDEPGQASAKSLCPSVATAQMVAAGVEVMWELEGEATKATLAAVLWEAMASHRPYRNSRPPYKYSKDKC